MICCIHRQKIRFLPRCLLPMRRHVHLHHIFSMRYINDYVRQSSLQKKSIHIFKIWNRRIFWSYLLFLNRQCRNCSWYLCELSHFFDFYFIRILFGTLFRGNMESFKINLHWILRLFAQNYGITHKNFRNCILEDRIAINWNNFMEIFWSEDHMKIDSIVNAIHKCVSKRKGKLNVILLYISAYIHEDYPDFYPKWCAIKCGCIYGCLCRWNDFKRWWMHDEWVVWF